MSKKMRFLMVTLVAIGALSAVLTGTVLAQEEEPAPVPAPFGGRGRAPGIGGTVGLEAAAEILGMTADDLALELWGGTTLADLAEEKGVDLQDIQDALTAAREAAMADAEAARRDAIEQAVEDGDITREHADWLLEGMDKGYMGGRGSGHFGGRDGFRGVGCRDGSGIRDGFPGMNAPSGDADA